MRCANCDAGIPDGEQFCPQCGVPVGSVARCPHCSAALLPGERFCGECGREVSPIAPLSRHAALKRKRPAWFWVLIVLAGLVVLGCLVVCASVTIPAMLATPTPVPTSTHTPMPTATPTLTPTPGPTATPTPSLQTGMLLLEEDFSEPGEDWEVSDTGDVAYALDGAQYSIQVNKENWMAWESTGEEYGDFIVQFETTLVEGDKFNSSGVFFRYQDSDNFYSLDINGNAKYAVGKEVDGEWIQIVDWTSSAALRSEGEMNVIRLVAYGNTFRLTVNDQFAQEFTDTSFNSGEIALHVTAYDSQPVRATFDNLSIWDVALR
jgi:predicted nucleic acid-binding Zn ribbon protein